MNASPINLTVTERDVTVHLVRHGETDWNTEGRLQGHTDIPLNTRGIEHANAAARALAGRPITAVISSDLARAQQTAVPIATQAGVPLIRDPALRERHYGSAEGRLNTDLDREFGGKLHERWADHDFAFEGGETRREAHVRLAQFFSRLLATPPAGEIVVVSHGGALRVARGVLERVAVEDLPKWAFKNGEVTTITVDANALEAICAHQGRSAAN